VYRKRPNPGQGTKVIGSKPPLPPSPERRPTSSQIDQSGQNTTSRILSRKSWIGQSTRAQPLAHGPMIGLKRSDVFYCWANGYLSCDPCPACQNRELHCVQERNTQ
jgi:hypothetical protein